MCAVPGCHAQNISSHLSWVHIAAQFGNPASCLGPPTSPCPSEQRQCLSVDCFITSSEHLACGHQMSRGYSRMMLWGGSACAMQQSMEKVPLGAQFSRSMEWVEIYLTMHRCRMRHQLKMLRGWRAWHAHSQCCCGTQIHDSFSIMTAMCMFRHALAMAQNARMSA